MDVVGETKDAAVASYFSHVDHLATPRLIADENQKTVWRWDQQEPFGATPPNEDPDADGVAFDFPMRFPGQYFDRETNLAYNYFRDYSAETGRYVESDPVGLLAGFNTYVYTFANPLRFADPRGLEVKGTWVKIPTVTDWAINVADIQPTLGWKWLPPTIKLIVIQLEGFGRIEYEIRCTDDKNMCGPTLEEWTIKGARPFATPQVGFALGPTVIPEWRVNLALSILGGVIEYGQAVGQINSYVAAEIAKIASDPTTYCRAFPKSR